MATASRELEFPELGDTTAGASSEEDALAALDANVEARRDADDADDEDEARRPDDSPEQLDVSPERSGEVGASGGRQARPAKPAKEAKEAKATKPPAPVDRVKERERRAKKYKRDELEALFLEQARRGDELEEKIAAVERRAAVTGAVNSQLIDESLDDLVGLAVDGTESLAQLFVSPRTAKAIALEDDERNHLVRLGSRYTRATFPAVVEQSPGWALVAGVVAIVSAKLVNVKLDRAAELERVHASPGSAAT